MASSLSADDEKIYAIVFLAEGNSCRCFQVDKSGCVSDLLDAILNVQEEWEEIGKDGPQKVSVATPTSASADSNTDELRLRYAIVEERKDKAGLITERVLPPSTPLKSPELRDLVRSWQRIYLRNMAQQFAQKFKEAQAKGIKPGEKARRASKEKPKTAYWFLAEHIGKNSAPGAVRVKFVNTDDYVVVRGKEGWVDVKEGGKIKSCWVVLKEDTLLYFKDPADAKPLGSLVDVSSWEITSKKGKGTSMIVKMKNSTGKLSLICENEVMGNKWLDAVRRGKSGEKKAASHKGRVFKLKVVPEMIPEYTEEEELAELAKHSKQAAYLSVGPHQNPYMTVQDGQPRYLSVEPHQNPYMTVQDGQPRYLSVGPHENPYMSIDDNHQPRYLSVDPHQNPYMTIDGHQQRPENPYMSVDEGQARYLSVDPSKPTYMTVGPHENPYMSIDDAYTPAYMTVEAMQTLANPNGYITLSEMHSLAKRKADSDYMTITEIGQMYINRDGDYLTLAAVQELCKDAGYITLQEAQELRNPSGGYLTVEDMRRLINEAGYLTTEEMLELYASE
eukprot:m.394628 g.394628  ORF g.394628 m.394628 type:complete len:560 (-) comp56379_c0_seq1:172-1851(-)